MLPRLLLGLSSVAAFSLHEIRPLSAADRTKPALLFDLDNTLYATAAAKSNFRPLTIKYIQSVSALNEAEAKKLFMEYRREYDAVVVRGLIEKLGVTGADFEKYIDDNSNLAETLAADPKLQRLLDDAQARRYVLTNSGLNHATQVLKRLGIYNSFHGILYIDYSLPRFAAKPAMQAYLDAMALIKEADPWKVAFVDDISPYVLGAHRVGWTAIHLDRTAPEGVQVRSGIITIRRLEDLRDALPAIFAKPANEL